MLTSLDQGQLPGPESRNVGAPILVFDSGVGGLTILDAIAQRLPGESLVFASDSAAFPYGPKPEDALVDRVHAVLDALVARYAPKLVVVACNTASTVALPRLRSHYTLPIVGVVPAIKPAAQRSQNRRIGLLATPGTVQRPYTDQLIAEFASDCTVVRVGSSELVREAEAKLRGQAPDMALLRALLGPIVAAGADTVVLGCTHFPLLAEELAQAAGTPLMWVDSGEAIARRVSALLTPDGLSQAAAPSRRAAFTRQDTELDALRPALSRYGLDQVDIVTVPDDTATPSER